MSLELPGWVVDVFYFVGLPWPGVDEDELRGWGKDLRTFASEITDLSRLSHDAVSGLAHSDQSAFLKTMAQHWDHHHAQIKAMREPMHAFADALDIAAEAVVVQKHAVIAAAVALAAAVGVTQGEALFTFGLAEAEVPVEVEATKKLIQFALQELENKLLGILINHAAAAISRHLNHTLGKLLMGGLGVANEAYALKTDTKSIRAIASTIKTHASRTEKTGSEAYRRSANRKIETDSRGGKWPIAAILEQALVSIAADLFRRLPGTLHQVMEDTEKDLVKAADALDKADAELAAEARDATPGGSPHGLESAAVTGAAGVAAVPRDGAAGAGREGGPVASEEDPREIVKAQVDRANSDPEWFKKHYKVDGRRHVMEGVDENGNPLPRLKLDRSDPEHPKWIAADDAPPPLPPLYKHDKTVVGHRPSADSEANHKLDDAVARREQAIAADQVAEKKLTEAKQAHDSDPSPDNKQRYEAADQAHKPAHTEMRDASEDLGDKTAEHHAVPENFSGAQRIDNRATGNNRFDQVWNRTGDHYVVVEAKAPSADLGSRESVTGRQVMQGHPEYFNAILAQMEKRGLTDPDEAELAEKLHQALEEGKLDYVLVKARVKDGEYDGYTMKHFDID